MQDFYLAGGTALALQIGHRKSVDLDFFTTKKINNQKIYQSLKQNFQNVQFQQGTEFIINGVKTEFLYWAYEPKFDFKTWNGIKLLNPIDIGLFKILSIIGRNVKKDIIDLYFIDEAIIEINELIELFFENFDTGDVNLLKQIETLFNDEEIEKTSNPELLKSFSWNLAYNEIREKIMKSIEFYALL